MSGICGVLNFDEQPADPQLLGRMTASIEFRGPDARNAWIDGPIGFGHTLLKTTFESEREHQPSSLDGRVWITADARIDGQAALKEKLRCKGRAGLESAGDADLILHAYHAWGEDCLAHLIGDFAFAIWDGRQRRLFCGRDHFGVKLFFYSLHERGLAFSNTMDCLRGLPSVTARLNELAIADFLLFEQNQDPGTTVFADIQRLPPGHFLVCSAAGLKVARYWTLQADLGVQHRPQGDYVARFKELFELAVSDRLRTNTVGVEMSGGLDSTSVAAMASHLLKRGGRPFDLRAHAIVYDELIPEEERVHAATAAEHLGIPIHFVVADRYELYERFDRPETALPEPNNDPDVAMYVDAIEGTVRHSRVALTGWDGDALMSESPKPYLRTLLREGRWVRALREALRYAAMERRLMPLALAEKLGLRPGKGPSHWRAYPAWLNAEFEKRLDLRTRWQRFNVQPAPGHEIRPYAYRTYEYVQRLSNFFDRYDAGLTRQALEYRHPLFDLRLVEFCLTLPPVPWCVRKTILRAAMGGLLPDTVRLRPKTFQPGYPHLERLRRASSQWVDGFEPAPVLAGYVDRASIPANVTERDPDVAWLNLRPLSLSFWLRGVETMAQMFMAEKIMKSEEESAPKQVYRRPELQVYGTIQAQTKTIGMGMMNDGMMNKSA